MFHTTRWSMVMHTRAETDDGRAALDDLCRVYRSPVLAYLRARGYPPSDAEDMTQAFFEQLLVRRMHAIADPERGRFRSFLLTSLKRFLANRHEHDNTLKRGGGQAPETLDACLDCADAVDLSPDAVFDRDYALTVVARAFTRLREEAAASGKADLFAAASEFLLESPDDSEYGELASRLGLRRNTLAVAIHRLRSRLRDLIRNELSLTVDDAGALHAEMSALHKALAPNRTASGGSAAP